MTITVTGIKAAKWMMDSGSYKHSVSYSYVFVKSIPSNDNLCFLPAFKVC